MPAAPVTTTFIALPSAREQLVVADARGAELADDDAAGAVGDRHRLAQRQAAGEHRGEGGDHRVAGAGDVEHLARLGRDLHVAGGVEQRHAVLGARQQQRARAERLRAAPATRSCSCASLAPGADHLGQLGAVRRDRRSRRGSARSRCPSDRRGPARPAARAGSIMSGMCVEAALAVVGEQDHVRDCASASLVERPASPSSTSWSGSSSKSTRSSCCERPMTRSLTIVVSRGSRSNSVSMPLLLEQRLEAAAVLVVADRGQQARLRAERLDVPGDVGGAAEPLLLLARVDAHDRHRRLGRDAVDRAEPVAVEHRVADDEDAGRGECVRGWAAAFIRGLPVVAEDTCPSRGSPGIARSSARPRSRRRRNDSGAAAWRRAAPPRARRSRPRRAGAAVAGGEPSRRRAGRARGEQRLRGGQARMLAQVGEQRSRRAVGVGLERGDRLEQVDRRRLRRRARAGARAPLPTSPAARALAA